MPASILDQMMDFYDDLFQSLFATPFNADLSNRRKRNDVSRRVSALADAASQSTIRMLTNQRMSEPDVERLCQGLQPLPTLTNHEELSQTQGTTQSLVDRLMRQLPDLQSASEQRMVDVYRAALYSILQSLLLIAPVLREWRNHGFPTTYDPLERVLRQLNDISEGMDVQAHMLHTAQTETGDEEYELTYRDYLVQRFYQIEAGTLRITTNLAVDIRDLFVMPYVQERPRSKESSELDSPHELMLLEQARQQFGTDATTRLSDSDHDSDSGVVVSSPALAQVLNHPLNILIGAPGSGKSTFLEWLQLSLAFPGLSRTNPGVVLLDTHGAQQVIPLLLRVRQLNPDALPDVNHLVESAIASQGVAALMPEGWIERQMTQGRILFMLDGVDEVAPEKRDAQLFPWFKDLIEAYPTCRYLVSSRPTGYPAGTLSQLGFRECDIQDFDAERIRAYTTNWHTAIRLARNELPHEARDKGKEDANRIIESFEANSYIQDLAKNPLMLSAICLVYEFEGSTLPEDRAKLYELCVEGLLHNWDERRQIRSPFTFSDKLRTCREVAIAMQTTKSSGAERIRDRESLRHNAAKFGKSRGAPCSPSASRWPPH